MVKISRSFKVSSLNTFVPIHGDEFLPIDPRTAFESGYFHDVDVLTGNVKDEGSVYLVVAFPDLLGPYGEKNAQINKTLGFDLILKLFQGYTYKQEVADYYLSYTTENDFDTVRSQVFHSKGDFRLFCPNLYFAEGSAERNRSTYMYYFSHQSRKTVFAPWMGVTHFSEVPFVFGRPLGETKCYTKDEAELSKGMIKLWTNFAKDG